MVSQKAGKVLASPLNQEVLSRGPLHGKGLRVVPGVREEEGLAAHKAALAAGAQVLTATSLPAWRQLALGTRLTSSPALATATAAFALRPGLACRVQVTRQESCCSVGGRAAGFPPPGLKGNRVS